MQTNHERQFTVVAFYGDKSPGLSDFIERVLIRITDSHLQKYFTPYATGQIHATLMGLEYVIADEIKCNQNILEASGKKRCMKFEGSTRIIAHHIRNLSIRFGGFNPQFDRNLPGTDLNLRSFGIHCDTGKVVLHGWPVILSETGFEITDAIWKMRSTLYREHNMRHKYHEFHDNDMFMVLGDLQVPEAYGESEQWEQQVLELEEDIKSFLWKTQPYYEKIEISSVRLVEYLQDSLEESTSQSWPLMKLEDVEFLQKTGLV